MLLNRIEFALMNNCLRAAIQRHFYAEEVFGALITHPVLRRLFEHPGTDRFEFEDFERALRDAGFSSSGSRRWGRICGWFVART